MAGIPVDVEEAQDSDRAGPSAGPTPSQGAQEGRRRARDAGVEVEIEREITKRHLIEAISSVLVVVLYMAFTLFRERDSGVVVIDGDDRHGPEDDWEEA